MKEGSVKLKSRSSGRNPSRAPRDGFLEEVASCDVIIPDPKNVFDYLKKHLDLKAILAVVVRKVRTVFGPETEFSLTLYRDPEIDDAYLTLCLRQKEYDAHFMDTIEKVSEQFHPKLEKVSGHLLLTTDFSPPRGAHGI